MIEGEGGGGCPQAAPTSANTSSRFFRPPPPHPSLHTPPAMDFLKSFFYRAPELTFKDHVR